MTTGALTVRLSHGNCAAKPAAMAPLSRVSTRLVPVTEPTAVIVTVTERAVSTTESTVTPRLDTPAAILSEDEALRLVCDALAT